MIIQELIRRGASVKAFDPEAMGEARRFFAGQDGVAFAPNKYDALDGADALFLVTEWKEFRSPDFPEMKQRMNSPIIFDGRNQYKASTLAQEGFVYQQIGVRGYQLLVL